MEVKASLRWSRQYREDVHMDQSSNVALSAQARDFLAASAVDPVPLDFEQIGQLRRDALSEYAAGAERAVSRHDLSVEETSVGGIDALRVMSRRSGTQSGSMLFLFGGAFVMGDPVSDLPLIGALAEYCGVEVIAPRYRLAPEHSAPAAGEDCLTVYQALAKRAAGRLLLAGESAGGNLALLTAQRACSEGIRMPDALALLSPAVDLRTDDELFAPVADADPILGLERVRDVARVYPGRFVLTDPALSPLFGVMESLPPTIITTGTRDLLLSQCLRLERKMRRAGVEVQCRVWDGLWHVFEYYDEYPEAAESLREIAAFLNGD